jgi:hypothetical protein
VDCGPAYANEVRAARVRTVGISEVPTRPLPARAAPKRLRPSQLPAGASTGAIINEHAGMRPSQVPTATEGGRGRVSAAVPGAEFARAALRPSQVPVRPRLGIGEALDPGMRRGAEQQHGHSFHGVRVHRDAAADAAARGLGARAFTSGTDVVFRAGAYEPSTPQGQRLVAHELAHVVQQARGARRDVGAVGARGDAWERAADAAAERGTATLPAGSVPAVQLQPDDVHEPTAGHQPGFGHEPHEVREKTPEPPAHDRPMDVLEAIVHMLSNLGVTFDTEGDYIVNHPSYALKVKKSVREDDHIDLLWAWWRVSTQESGDRRIRIEEAARTTEPILGHVRKDRRPAARRWVTQYESRLEQIRQLAARDEVNAMIEAGVKRDEELGAEARRKDVPGEAGKESRGSPGGDAETKTLAARALGVISELSEVSHRLAESREHMAEAHVEKLTEQVKEAYDKELSAYIHQLFTKGDITAEAPDLATFPAIKHAAASPLGDGLTVIKGGLDAVLAIETVTDPERRRELFAARENIFGRIAQGAEVNSLLWRFVSGTIAFGGATVYGMARLAGEAELAEHVLEATVKGISNVTGPLFLVGVVHGAATLLDPQASPDEKAEAAVETASSAIGAVGFASRWVPRLAGVARWSGPIAASLTINFFVLKYYFAPLVHRAEVGLSSLDWVECWKTTRENAAEIQLWQRRLAVTEAILAHEKDPRRRHELEQRVTAFSTELVDSHLRPFVDGMITSSGLDDPRWPCGPALQRRLRALQSVVKSAGTSPDSALAAAAVLLLTVDQAFTEWDAIVMEKESAKKEPAQR